MTKVSELLKKYSIYLILVVLIGFFTAMNPVFLTGKNIMNIIRQVSYLGVGCVGMMACMLCGTIDLSLGASVTLNNIIMAVLMVKLGVHPVLACLTGIIVSSAFGLLNGWVYSNLHMPPMIVTLSTKLIMSGIAYLMVKGMPVYGFPNGFSVIGQGYIAGVIPICAICMFVCLIIAAFIFDKTTLGRHFFAVGSNANAALLAGVNVKRVQQIAYMLSGFFAGLAGIVLLSRTMSGQVTAGDGLEFNVISALTVGGVSIEGGTGKVSRALIGILIMGILTNGFVIIGVSTYMQDVIKGTILLVSVGFDCVQRYRARNAT